MPPPRLFTARLLLASAGELLGGGGLLVRAGRIERVLASRGAVRRLALAQGIEPLDLGEGTLTAGLVDAHAHLELGALAGRLPRGGSFAGWIAALVAARRGLGAGELECGLREGARRLAAGGTTLVGDIDSSGAAERALATMPLRSVVYRELLDAGDAQRRGSALERVRRALPARARRREGLSPHAPFSASPELLAAAGRLARRRRLPVAIHWAETEAEVEWLEHGRGELAGLLARSPRRRALELIAGAGLLGARTALVHGNHPGRGDLERVAASGATLVHCPGSHRWFGRAPFDLAACLRAGVRLALGTDSLASNDALDMRRELRLLREGAPELDPGLAWRMATEHGAAALGLPEEGGRLAPGARADLCLWSTRAAAAPELLEELTAGEPALAARWLAGRRSPAGAAGEGALPVRRGGTHARSTKRTGECPDG